jgi:hypothetical protein
MEGMRQAVLYAQNVLQNLDDAAAGRLPPLPPSLAAYGPAAGGGQRAGTLPRKGFRRHLAGLSVRELRRVLQLLGVDSSGCLEKEELVEKVMQTPGAIGAAAAVCSLPDACLHDGAADERQGAAAAPQAAGSGDSSSQPPERRCARCGARPSEAIKLRRCACGLVRYCGERCQGEDWAGHKAACKEARRRRQGQEAGGAA